MESKQFNLGKFNGNDFAVWKGQMEALLYAKDLGEAITEVATGTETERAAFIKMDRKARSLLLLALDNKYAKLVLKCATAKEIWDRSVATHECKSVNSKIVI